MPITTTPSGGPQGEFSTYTPISSQTLSSNATSITFSNIPTTFTDLRLVMVPASSSGTNGIRMRVGSGTVDTGSNYSNTFVDGNGTNAASYRESSQSQFVLGYRQAISTTLNQIYTLDFLNYSNTTTNKTVLLRYTGAASAAGAGVLLWRSINPINTLSFNINTFGSSTGDFITGSTFTLYGIKAAATQFIPTKAAGGDVVVSDGTYAYHVFRSSGVFAAAQALSADVLVVAGAGGGGSFSGGGGGAGGLLAFTSQSLTAQNYSITVGAGGAGSTATANKGSNGGNSQFQGLTASAGGGGGGSDANKNGEAGGSGGGGSPTPGSGGAASPSGQGNAGGSAGGSSPWPGGGGGGAGAAGGAGSGITAGSGGNGVSTYSSWGLATGTGQNISGTVWYAGGGGGGAYGIGGGVAGAGGSGGGGAGTTSNIVGGAGITATGGGGGASGQIGFANGGNGGSGVVIVRYAV